MAEDNNQTAPQSSAPNFDKLEQDILNFWDENQIFQKSLEQTKNGEPYVFYDGPPFATGLPHYGSILPSVIKDCIPRYQTMKGRYVRRRWGWDCHGLPIENLVEKNLKISGKKQIEEIGVERFNKVCRDNVLNLAHEWGKMVRRIARWVDFDNSYKTMDTAYMESVWWALKQIWEKDLIYEDRKVLLYCPRCETPISNFEVAMDNSYQDVTEESVYAKFKILPRQRIVNDLTNDRTYALAWTTTPWTLPGNTALNVGAEIDYVIIELEDKTRYVLAKERLSVIGQPYETIAEFKGHSLEGLGYEPLFSGVIQDPENRAWKIYAADFVTTEDGTGIVHNAAMYGEDDYQLAKSKNLPRQDMLDHKGQYLPNAPENLRGLFFKDADRVVIKDLREKNLLYKAENFTHSYPHCYRCGTPLYYNALAAWFINIQSVKQQLIDNNQSINWYPEHLKFGRFQQGIENAPDWNISRNRYWATALPFWKCENKDCKNVSCVGSVEELKNLSANFAEVYPNYNPADIGGLDLHKPYIDYIKLKCAKCGGAMSRVPEVVDCWVESGSMPFAELHSPFENRELFEQRFPSDFVVEYIPQTRAWFYVSHVMSSILFGRSPFRNIMTTGTILGEDGTKMSKSKGNYPDPNAVIEKYGADALRLYLLTSPVVSGEDINFSEKNLVDASRKVSLLLYNVWSFYRMYEKSVVSGQLSAVSSEHILDKWIVARLYAAHAVVTQRLDTYDTVRAGREIMDLVNDISTWYVRRSRDRIKEGNENSKNTLAALGFVLAETSKLLAPFAPFLAEFVFRDVTGEESVHLAAWSKLPEADKNLLAQMQLAREVVETGLSLRKERNLKVRQPLAELEYHINDKNTAALDDGLNAIIAEELNVKKISPRGDFAPKAGWTVKETAAFKLALNIELDDRLKAEGLARELERQVQDLRKKSGLKVGELVDVYYNTQDEELERVFLSLFDRKKTFVSQVNKSFEVEVDFETQAVVEGRAVWIGVVKI